MAGFLFRPAPSDESSLQMNVILASSVIYPTLFDLMGLRWSPYVGHIESKKLDDELKNQRYRKEQLEQHLLLRTSNTVNDLIGLPKTSVLVEDTDSPASFVPPVPAANEGRGDE